MVMPVFVASFGKLWAVTDTVTECV